MVNLFLEFGRHTPSPERFRKWAAIHAIGASAERRVWSSINGMKLHPNLYLMLVGPPGVGKSIAINPVSELLRKSQTVNIAPTDMTKQGLLDMLITCGKGAIIAGTPFDYHFMSICISELSNFMSQYDGALAGLLTDLFDCPPILEEKKRGVPGGSKVIPYPGLSFIMGTATQNLGATITDEMWGSGFMARVILIYSDHLIRPGDAKSMFSVPVKSESLAAEIDATLRRIGELKGEMIWDFGAQQNLWEFWTKEEDTAPIHNRLAHYTTRRWMHVGKLCMIAALAEERMVILPQDFQVAKAWLLDAESQMSEVFKGMVSHEDGQIYEELQSQMWTLYMRGNKRAIPAAWIYEFLKKRVSSFLIPRVIEVAVASGSLQRQAGTSGDDALYIPMPVAVKKNLEVI